MEGTPQSPESVGKKPNQGCSGCSIASVIGILIVVFGVAVGPITPAIHGHQNWYVQTSHALGLAMYSYANDNGGLYPDGTSSTEVFQKLMDGGYVTDPSIFYVAMDGKIKAAEGQKKLKPENVCWDVTGGASGSDNGALPLVFLTGYRFTYAPGGGFTPLTPFPPYQSLTSNSGLPVFFINNSCSWLVGQSSPVTNLSIAHFLPSDFNAHGKTYRQLTPDGVLR